MVTQLLANAVVVACGYAILALGFSLIYSSSRVFHVAYGAVFTAGAYSCYSLSALLRWPTVPVVCASVVVCVVLGAIIEVTVYDPLAKKKAPPLVALLSSLGVYIVMVNTVALTFGSEARLVRLAPDTKVTLGAISLTSVQVAQLAVAILLIPLVVLLIRLSGWGRRVRAVTDNPDLAALLGIDARKVRLQVVILGSALAGIAAVLRSLDVGISPNMGMNALLVAATGTIVGGVTSSLGAVFGGVFVGLVSAGVTWMWSDRWTETASLLVLLGVLILRPKGLASSTRGEL